MDEQSRESGDTTPIEYSGPTTRSHANLERTKESEKGEFEDSNIVSKNDHGAKRNVTPGMFVFSCIHRVILGKSLPLFSLLGPKICFDCHIYPKFILINKQHAYCENEIINGLIIAHVVIPFISGAIFLTETEMVRHAFQVLAERFTKEELQRTTLVIILYY